MYTCSRVYLHTVHVSPGRVLACEYPHLSHSNDEGSRPFEIVNGEQIDLSLFSVTLM